MVVNFLQITIINTFILLILITDIALPTNVKDEYLSHIQNEDSTKEMYSDQLPQIYQSTQSKLNLSTTQDQNETTDNFSWALLKSILQKENQNVIFSPFSIRLILALLFEAAGNNTETQKELARTQTHNEIQEDLRYYFRDILKSLKENSTYHTLNLETKIYADSFIQPKQRYSALLYSYYDTKIQNLQFNDPKSAVTIINDWCSNVTHDRLNQLVNENNIQNSVMLMANVIYFNGLWDSGFNNTYEGVFLKTSTDQIKVDYMEQTGYFFYHDSNNFGVKILRLPYKGNKFSMFILLTKNNNTLDELINTLQIEQYKKMQQMMHEVKVKVTLPKFKFEFQKNVQNLLQELGIQEIFKDSASLPGFATSLKIASKLKVSSILQKAGIDVNEIGTEVYASTVVEIENKFGGSSSIEEFYVNQPFIFFIEEAIMGNVIFAGKVLEPLV